MRVGRRGVQATVVAAVVSVALLVSACGGSNPQATEAPDRRLAHRSRHQRSHRSSQQPDQAGQAGRLRLHVRNYRIRSLLYAGKPDWALLATFTPR
jgi:hypothetical protein